MDLEGISAKSLFLLVENQNNPSLEFKSIQAYQDPYFLNTYLEKDKKYRFSIGPDSLGLPVYDLANFDNQIGAEIPVLEIINLKKEEFTSKHSVETFFKTKLWIWVGLLFVAGLLAYMCVQMMKEIKK
ncbi:hypothetical protein [Dyadobacter sp. NIV53]|uniref:hypothetical protein n=1 Tax=Dyadobacter sp. NIV53 TaxID=2861765 RepID=UPI001C8896F5|nr:hypothetical protein [Dyadobacter sp. NIV53]